MTVTTTLIRRNVPSMRWLAECTDNGCTRRAYGHTEEEARQALVPATLESIKSDT